MALKHAKTNNVASWTQAQLDAQIQLGNFAPGTTIADITLSQDWNSAHVIDSGGITFNDATVQTTAATGNVVGPASSTDNAIVRFDGTTGKIIQDYTSTPPTISDTGQVFIGNLTPALTATNINSGTSSNANIAVNSMEFTGAVGAAGSVQGINSTVTDNGTNNINAIAAMSFLGQRTGASGTTASITGVSGVVGMQGGCTATLAQGSQSIIRSRGASNIVTAIGYAANSPVTGTGGTIGTCYGVRVQAQKAAAITTAYGMACDGASDINYFMGLAGFGLNAPGAYVDALGGTTANASIRIRAGVAPTTPNDGDVWNETVQKQLVYNAGSNLFYNRAGIFLGTADGTVTNTTTPTTMFGTGVGTKTIAANSLTPGKTINILMGGTYAATTIVPNLVITVKISSVTVATATITNLQGTTANTVFQLNMMLQVRTAGVSGTVTGNGNMNYSTGLLARGFAPLSTQATPVVIDTTSAQAIDVTATWSAASASNTITSTTSTIEITG